jgi:hypothetical protein
MLQYSVSIPSTVEEVKLISSYFIHALSLLSLLSQSIAPSFSRISLLWLSRLGNLFGFDCDYGLNGCGGFVVKGCWRLVVGRGFPYGF